MARTQIDRPFRLKCTLGDDALLLESFEGVERISTPYRYVLRVLAESPDIDTKALLKKPVVLTLVLTDKSERHIHGNISRMKLAGTGEDGLAAYVLEMTPWFWFLHLFSDCRIFQNKSVTDIVQQVFKDRGFSDFRLDTQGSYPPLEYCVQYRETDFNFVSRLLEQEGIFYYFEQSTDKATMVLTDVKEKLTPCSHQDTVRFMPAEGGVLAEDTIQTLEEEVRVHTGKASLTDYDFEKPANDLSANLAAQDTETDGEFYDYPGNYTVKSEGERYARVRLEEQEVRMVTVRAETNCMGLECGYKTTLKEHFREAANMEYAIVALSQKGQNSSYRSNADVSAFKYSNSIEAIPSSVPFRPPRIARKPVIRGVQTAVVVGKAGEEIWTDQYGRVRVQFFWDRQGNDDDKSTCWIRVSHAWAGKMWGTIYLPRIGQEVIVSFIEGDPDRPIVVGRVYNADQMPPYPLPGEQTKSTLKSMSSKGGGGFNELRFEDKKGSEQVFLHAEKNLDIQVKSDRMENIGNNRSLTVVNDKYEKIGNDEHNHTVGKRVEKIEGDHLIQILGKEGIKITGDHSLSVQGNVTLETKGNQSLGVTQNLYIKGLQVVIEAEIGLTIKMGPNFITLDPSGIAISGVPMVQINSAGSALSGSPGQPVPVDPPKDPVAADNADPGGVTSPPNPNPVPPASMSLQDIAPATKSEPEDEPDRPAPAPGGGGGSPSSQPDYATFPKDVDPVALAEVLKQAAQDGAPFCEECQKAAQQQMSSGGGGGSADVPEEEEDQKQQMSSGGGGGSADVPEEEEDQKQQMSSGGGGGSADVPEEEEDQKQQMSSGGSGGSADVPEEEEEKDH